VNIYSNKELNQALPGISGSGRAVVARRDHPFVVVGLGETGLSCVRHLMNLGAKFAVVDSREAPPGVDALRELFPNAPLHTGSLTESSLENANVVVLSPGVPREHPAVVAALASGCSVIGDIELFARCVQGPVSGITGSNGKSTVTCMLGAMFDQAGQHVSIGGNLGPPALDLLSDEDAQGYVLELSSFQLESTESLELAVGTILNVSEDHLDRYVDMAAYVDAKARILDLSNVVVLPPELVSLLPPGGSPTVKTFSSDTGVDVDYGIGRHQGQDWLMTPSGPLLPVDEVGVPGRHNVANALAAAAMAEVHGLELEVISVGLREFKGLEHRCQLVSCAGGRRWINDSKATNVGATRAAVQGLAADGPIILIAGGQGKGGDFSPLNDVARDAVRYAVLIGEDAPLIRDALDTSCEMIDAPDMRAAVRIARDLAQAGDTVLLSPACASFDMYDNYQARGRDFVACVQAEVGL
jgi:UDP-N-acetylmuramoylalanine--D-glutamate ligase